MAREIHSEILIDAPAERVWRIITDLDRYAEWNPFIPRASGKVLAGNRIQILVQAPGLRPVRFRPRVMEVVPGRRFHWLGRVIVPGLFDGRHHFELHDEPDGRVRLVQWERITGLLLPLIWGRIGAATEEGYRQMNQAVKQRAEANADV